MDIYRDVLLCDVLPEEFTPSDMHPFVLPVYALTNPQESFMTYRNRLYPWCIIRQLPNFQRITVTRFRKRNEAEEH
ncbi:MAG TPA: hypothetical protein V6D29_17010, partial [Leptolyngbyaceae cyanobacterium]